MYVVSYDLSNNKLRKKVAKVLEGYGRRVQYSVFECRISKKTNGAAIREAFANYAAGTGRECTYLPDLHEL